MYELDSLHPPYIFISRITLCVLTFIKQNDDDDEGAISR